MRALLRGPFGAVRAWANEGSTHYDLDHAILGAHPPSFTLAPHLHFINGARATGGGRVLLCSNFHWMIDERGWHGGLLGARDDSPFANDNETLWRNLAAIACAPQLAPPPPPPPPCSADGPRPFFSPVAATVRGLAAELDVSLDGIDLDELGARALRDVEADVRAHWVARQPAPQLSAGGADGGAIARPPLSSLDGYAEHELRARLGVAARMRGDEPPADGHGAGAGAERGGRGGAGVGSLSDCSVEQLRHMLVVSGVVSANSDPA